MTLCKKTSVSMLAALISFGSHAAEDLPTPWVSDPQQYVSDGLSDYGEDFRWPQAEASAQSGPEVAFQARDE